jgi:hypothetical protein
VFAAAVASDAVQPAAGGALVQQFRAAINTKSDIKSSRDGMQDSRLAGFRAENATAARTALVLVVTYRVFCLIE